MKKLLLYLLLTACAFGQGQVLQEASAAQAAAGTAGAGYYISPRRQGGGTGSPGTVTSVSITPTSTVTGTVTNASTTPAIALTAITNPSPTGSNLVAGGSVAFVSNLSLTVGAADYIIQGVSYSSPITTLTASAADPTFDRIDIVAVNSSGAAVLIEGTPAASPVAPDVDPASQLALTFYILSAGATSIPISVTDIYHNNAEWTMSRSGTTWTLASTNNPYTGSVCIEGTAVATGNSFTATAPGDIDLADHDSLIFYIRNKAAWPSTRQISIQWLNNSNVVKGTVVTLKNGTYGFNALTNTTAYQQISIPLSAFGANGLAVRKLRFQLAGTGTTIGAYVDDITLQGGLSPVVDNSKMQWRGTYSATNLYNVNDVVISSGIQYVAIAPSVGQTPASSTTYWQPSTAAGATGTVSTVSVTTANGVSGSVANATTTPAISLTLGAITPTSVTTTGINSAAGASVEVANAMAALAIDVTKGLNTKTIAADSTFTFSGTPANSNQGFTLRLTNSDTNNHVITIPSTFDTNAQATTTSFTILAGGIETITWIYNGSTYLGYNVPSPAYSAEITVASATTTNIGAAASVNVAISGTTAITGFGTVAAGTYRQGRFTGALTFTHSSALLLPNAGSNITTAANDRFGAYSLGSGNWLVLWYQRANGTAVAGGGGSGTVGSGTATQLAVYTGTTTVGGDSTLTSTATDLTKSVSGAYSRISVTNTLSNNPAYIDINRPTAAADGLLRHLSTSGSSQFWETGMKGGNGDEYGIYGGTSTTTRYLSISTAGTLGFSRAVIPFNLSNSGITLGSLELQSTGATDNGQVARNAYFNGSQWTYRGADNAQLLSFASGGFYFSQAGAGSAGAAVSFTQAVAVTPARNLLVGSSTSETGLTGAGGLIVQSTTVSSAYNNGAAIIAGGLGIGSNVRANGSYLVEAAGSTLFIKGGTNAKAGTFTLSSGAATVSNTSITTNSIVIMSLQTSGGAITQQPYLTARTSGSGFVVGAGAGDNSTYNYIILEYY